MATHLPDRIRHRFPLLAHRVYMNSCSQGALSDAVRAAYAEYLADWDSFGAPWELWVDRAEAARRAFASLLNADENEIAVTTSTSAGVSALLSGLAFEGGRDKIVISDFEFPTIGQITHAQELRGRKVVHVPAGADATIPLEHFDEAIDESTGLVAITQVCYRNGSRLDVEGVVGIARERGALVLLDTYQAVGAIPIDVRALDVDFAAGGVLKYLLGSAGLGFLYCRADLVPDIVPTQTGWFADQDIFEMDISDYSPSPTARRFESGTPPIPAIYAGVAGMELMFEVGIAATEEHVRSLNTRLIGELGELGATVVTPADPARRGPMVAVASTDDQALVAELAAEGVLTTSRDGNVRISSHCYTSEGDIDAVVAALGRHRRLLA